MHISKLQIALLHGCIVVDEDSLELLALENSTSIVWKFFGFPSHEGRILESDKKK